MLNKIVYKLKDPMKNYTIQLGSRNMPMTHLSGRTTSGWLHLFKLNRLIVYFEYGRRVSEKNQYIPIYYTQNNSYITFGLGFLKLYAGFRLAYNRNPRKRKIYFYR